ncbi:MAG: choice-of-anchor Q domain-containing protein [Paludibacter sp.]
MKKVFISLTAIFFFVLFPTSVFASVWYVTPTGAGALDGTSWANATSDLQLIINNSNSGDEIWVAAGTYKPNRRADALGTITTNNRYNSFVLKSGVKIYGGFAGAETLLTQRNWVTNVTTLSGDLGTTGATNDNSYHVVISSGAAGTAELNGFTVTAGNANTFWESITVNGISVNSGNGGGIICHNSSPAVVNSTVISCLAAYGGGIYNADSSPALTEVSINLSSSRCGGGIFNTASSPILSNCTISSNNATEHGGGMYNISSSSAVLSNVVINSNTATYTGGGMYNESSSPLLTGVTIHSNSANQKGGGMMNTSNSSPTIVNIIIRNNSISNSWSNGGGMYNESSSNPTITNALIYKNNATGDGGGIYNSNSTPIITNATIVYNTTTGTGGNGNGAGVAGNGTLQNCIIWGNAVDGIVKNVSGSPTYSYCLVEGGTKSGTAIISNSNPLFANTATDDYHLTGPSPGINKGSNALNATLTDVDGNSRIFSSAVIDLGAYEYQSADAVFEPDVNGILYVKKGSNGNGNSWANAIGELSDALFVAGGLSSVTQIWVAAGTYFPAYAAGDGATDRDKAFVLINNVRIYGGFAGTETNLSQRNINTNNTILKW